MACVAGGFIASVLQAQNITIAPLITTVAGNGTEGFSGNGGPATSAELAAPYDLAVDSTGNLYIVDAYNNRIRKVSAATGTITTVAGNGTSGYSGGGGAATSAELAVPMGVAVDSAGNLYIADKSNNRSRQGSASKPNTVATIRLKASARLNSMTLAGSCFLTQFCSRAMASLITAIIRS